MRFFEDIEIGQRREIGTYTFTADRSRLAAKFDPQRFHLDEEEGKTRCSAGSRPRAGMSARPA